MQISSKYIKILIFIIIILCILFFLLVNIKAYKYIFLLLGIIFTISIFLKNKIGKKTILLIKDSYKEMYKVVWPSPKETIQTTFIVFIFLLIMSLFLWFIDSFIEWIVFSSILGWK